MKAIFIYVTCPSLEVAQSIGRKLLESRVVGCVNIFPVTAIYRWEGKIVDENEVAMILKSTEFLSDAAIAEVKRLHTYQVPCIAKIPVQINEPFGRWIECECENFTFKPVEASNLSLLYSWFKKPHVDLWWPVPAEQEDFFKSFLERIRAGIKKPYLVICNDNLSSTL